MSATLLGVSIIVGACLLGFSVMYFMFNVNILKDKETGKRKPLMNGKEGLKYWNDFTENRTKFESDKAWKEDYEKRNPHTYNELVSTRP